jgi:isoquinoline 1-oxidoreductase beta subunit
VFGVQGTGGSSAIANSYEQMRKVGRRAGDAGPRSRDEWNACFEITVDNGIMRHPSGKEGAGAFAKAMRQPMPSDLRLKEPSQFKLIGKPGAVTRLDSAIKSNGSAQYTIDINDPDTLTALIARSPRFGGTVASFDAAAALAVPGVVDVKQVPNGIAVYAKGFWPAKTAHDRLKITWDDSKRSRAERRNYLASFGHCRGLREKPSNRREMSMQHSPGAASSSRSNMCFLILRMRRWSRSTRS